MQNKQWNHPGSLPPKKFKRVHSAEKVMVSIFWDSQGVIIRGDKRCILCRRIKVVTPGNRKKEARKTVSRCSVLVEQRPCPHVTSCHDCC